MSNIFSSIEGACAGSKPGGSPQGPDAPPPSQEAPPPYSTLPSAPMADGGVAAAAGGGATAWTNHSPPAPAASLGFNSRGFKVAYMDFVPRVLKKKKLMGSTYEDFSGLVQRANSWIEEHNGISVVSCETVTWTGRQSEDIYADKCFTVPGNRVLRGLRMWYMTEVVPSPHRSRSCQVLHCRTFQPKPSETFTQLLSRVNETLTGERVGGKILCAETMPLYCPPSEYKPGAVNPGISRWTGDVSHASVALCLRVYILVTGETLNETLGYQDFVPEHNQRHADNKGFEVCSEIMDKATRWVARQQGVRFTNVQTVNVKHKKKIPFQERCVFTVSDTTVFLSIARVFYVTSAGRGATDIPPCRLTYRTFTPAQTANLGIVPEYEDTRNLCDRVNQWLQLTGAQIFSMETVSMRFSSGLLGSEATRFRAGGERLYHIRIYLNGEYVEPPGAQSLVFSQPKSSAYEYDNQLGSRPRTATSQQHGRKQRHGRHARGRNDHSSDVIPDFGRR